MSLGQPGSSKRYIVTAHAYDSRGRLVSIGRNNYNKTHPIQARFAVKAGQPDRIFLHAEIDALIRAKGSVHKLVVSRYDSKGKAVNACPCDVCQLAIKHYKVKRVEYTV